jgi:predicted acylesterase/phospholipase RssA
VLAISGGGSNGAFGSGFINGWTASGTRPDFKIVTGVSTGSLQAVLAFLGPEYDPVLEEIYTLYTGDDVAVKRSALAALFTDATWDLSPLGATIRQYVTDELVATVAAKHEAGYRLYVGTTNMDTAEFVIWDMGRIAASDRADKREHFVKVLHASCSVPVLFPPVYFEVEGDDGEAYHEMHSDGSTYSQVFFRGFLVEFDDAVDLEEKNVEVRLFVIRNGKLDEVEARDNLKPRVPSIAARSIESLFKITLEASLYRMYVLARRYGIEFNLAAIPGDDKPDLDPLLFEEQGMKRLYDLGYRLASEGYDWMQTPPRLDAGEIIDEPTG